MYVKYSFVAGAPRMDVLNDIAALLTGTPISNLSAACNKAATSILANTDLGNWELYDSVPASYYIVLRSKNYDGNGYKYVQITNTTTKLTLTLYESWNAATHTGTNAALLLGLTPAVINGGTTYTVSGANHAGAATLYFLATSRTLFLDWVFVGEFTKDTCALDSSYPSSIIIPFAAAVDVWGGTGGAWQASYSGIGVCRYRGTAGDVCQSGASTGALKLVAVSPYSPMSFTARRVDETVYYPIDSFYASAYQAGYLGKIFDLAVGAGRDTSVTLAAYDEVSIDGNPYIYFANVSSNYMNLFLPKV